jgi:hypothetical protein
MNWLDGVRVTAGELQGVQTLFLEVKLTFYITVFCVQLHESMTFRRNISPPSTGSRNKIRNYELGSTILTTERVFSMLSVLRLYNECL